MNTIDFINITGQQSFSEKIIKPIEIKIEIVTVKNMIERCKKKRKKGFALEGLLFSISVQNNTEKYLLPLLVY